MLKKSCAFIACLTLMMFVVMVKGSFMKNVSAQSVSAPENLKLSSSSFNDQGEIPLMYSYHGGNISPQLSWSAGPQGTKSYVVICQDPDAPRKDPWVHWVVFNISGDKTSLDQGLENSATLQGLQQGRNDYPAHEKQIGWGGPNPPSGVHRYYFYVYALDSELSELKGKVPTKDELLNVMKRYHILAQGSLMGTFSARK